MKEVYVLIESVQHFRPSSRTEWVVAVCKNKESVIEVVNEKLKEMETDFEKQFVNGPIAEGDISNFKEVSKKDIFKWLTNTETEFITDDYTFLERFFNDGHRRDAWSFYVQKLPVR